MNSSLNKSGRTEVRPVKTANKPRLTSVGRDFLSQDLGPYAYWDMDNPDNRLEEFIYYWEMQESGLHMEPAASDGVTTGNN